jgi:hypothetical protein
MRGSRNLNGLLQNLKDLSQELYGTRTNSSIFAIVILSVSLILRKTLMTHKLLTNYYI